MAKFLIEYFLLIVGVLILFTNVVLPSIIPGMEYWWLFKKSKKKTPKDGSKKTGTDNESITNL
jgi:hypothetical protein